MMPWGGEGRLAGRVALVTSGSTSCGQGPNERWSPSGEPGTTPPHAFDLR